ncbi:uncharacterized protein METZ01_LOCUS258624, partial [marine metagenome]
SFTPVWSNQRGTTTRPTCSWPRRLTSLKRTAVSTSTSTSTPNLSRSPTTFTSST